MTPSPSCSKHDCGEIMIKQKKKNGCKCPPDGVSASGGLK